MCPKGKHVQLKNADFLSRPPLHGGVGDPVNALSERDLVLGASPFAEPNAALVIAVGRAGGLGVLDLGRDATVASSELDLVVRRLRRPFGVRLVEPCPVPLPE